MGESVNASADERGIVPVIREGCFVGDADGDADCFREEGECFAAWSGLTVIYWRGCTACA